MQKFITIAIPTKPYIKAYVTGKLGEFPLLTKGRKGDTIGHKLYDLLEHATNENKYRYDNVLYTVEMKVRIPIRAFRRRGHCLNETNLTNFNLFIEQEVKEKFYFYMDEFYDRLPNFENNIPAVRDKLKIAEEFWNEESMKKLYYRYRQSDLFKHKVKR